MCDLRDNAFKEKYNIMKINDPLIFVKNALDWHTFTPLLNDPYHNDTDNGGRPNIPVKTMVRVLFLQSMFNKVDEQAEILMRDRISFRNFLDYPDLLTDTRTIWLFRERLSKTGKDRFVFNQIRDQIMKKHIRIKKGTMQDASFIVIAHSNLPIFDH